MLDIILQILSILGIILLVLLVSAIIVLLLVLFFPVSYRVCGSKDAEGFVLSVKVKWLFGLLRARYGFPEPGKTIVKLLCFTLYDSGNVGEKGKKAEQVGKKSKKQKKRTKKEKSEKKKYKKEHSEKKQIKKAESEKEIKRKEERSEIENSEIENSGKGKLTTEKTVTKKSEKQNPETKNLKIENLETENSETEISDKRKIKEELGKDRDSEQEEDSSEDNIYREGEPEKDSSGMKEKISQKFQKIKYTIRSIYDKIKKIWENISYYLELLQEDDTKELFSHILSRVGRVLKNIRPRYIKANILLGTGSPDTTGYIYGICCMMAPVLGIGFWLTPDFEQAVFKGEFEVAGHVTIWVLLVNGLKLFLDKKLQSFINKLKKEF